MSGLFYIDGRLTSDYNTGSDLFPQKEQDGYAVFNARIGLRGPDEAWALELWGQNIFNQDYAQVAFNTPFQAGTTAALRLSIRNIQVVARSSRSSWPNRGPMASPCAASSKSFSCTTKEKGLQRCGPFFVGEHSPLHNHLVILNLFQDDRRRRCVIPKRVQA